MIGARKGSRSEWLKSTKAEDVALGRRKTIYKTETELEAKREENVNEAARVISTAHEVSPMFSSQNEK